MPVGLAIGAIGSAVIGGISSSKAANAQQQASQAATAEQRREYDQTRKDQMPWITAGQGAITTLGGMVGPNGELWKNFSLDDFQTDPGYQFRLAEGAKALNNSAAARGMALSGGALKAMDRYNQDFASNEYGNAYNRFQLNRATRYNQLAGVAGLGQSSANTMAQVGMNTANNIGNNLMYGGNARASGYMGMANAFNQGVQGLGNAWAAYKDNGSKWF